MNVLAYLDPGSGNALVYLLVSLGGVLVYFLKGTFYKIASLFGGQPTAAADGMPATPDVVIFTEGTAYWYTFKAIAEELTARKVHFAYITMDPRDPGIGMALECPYMHAQYVGKAPGAYARIARARGKYMLATTPNIGCAGYPLPRPKNIGSLVHINHAVHDVSYYKLGSLDYFDVTMEIGTWSEPRIRKLETMRATKPKTIVPAGLPYLDELAKNARPKQGVSTPLCVLVAPSWGDKCSLRVHGLDYLKTVIAAGFRVIVRPHPQTWRTDAELIGALQTLEKQHSNMRLDHEQDATLCMSESDILISDSSLFRYDFAFLYKRPVITMHISTGDLSTFEAGALGGAWDEDVAPRLGAVVRKGDPVDLAALIRDLASRPADTAAALDELYAQTVVNHGTAAKAIVDWLLAH